MNRQGAKVAKRKCQDRRKRTERPKRQIKPSGSPSSLEVLGSMAVQSVGETKSLSNKPLSSVLRGREQGNRTTKGSLGKIGKNASRIASSEFPRKQGVFEIQLYSRLIV